MIRERKNCHLLLLPRSEPSRGLTAVAQLTSAPARCQRLVPPRRGTQVSALCGLLPADGRVGQEQRRCLVSKGSGAALEGKVPHSRQRAQQTRLREQRCPLPVLARRFRLLLPPAQPSVPTSHCGWGATKERPGPGERIPAPKNQSPGSSAGSGGDKLRGAEKEGPVSKVLQQRETRGRCGCGDASHAAGSPRRARPGCQAGKCRTERKKKNRQTKQNKTK